MNDHPRDDLTERIARALRSREAAQPDVDVVTARLEARLARPRPVSDLTRRGGKAVVAGVVLSALTVAGAGAAAAANPYSDLARAVETAAQAVGLEWSAMPAGYTRAQYEAFWGAGYTGDDVARLGALWNSDATQTKARVGQLILDGKTPPAAAAASGAGATQAPDGFTQAQAEAFWGAGYTADNLLTLDQLWNSESGETKARAGQLILDGRPLPITSSQADAKP